MHCEGSPSRAALELGNTYDGLLPPQTISQRRFIALLVMLRVADLDEVSQQSKRKHCSVWWLLLHVNEVPAKLFKPSRLQ